MRMLARCRARRVVVSSILCGPFVIYIYGYFGWSGNTFVNNLKPVKGQPVYDARYEPLDLSEENSSCWKIIRGDLEAVENALLKSSTIANKYKPFTEIDYLKMTRDCDSFVKNCKYITFPLCAEERDFPLAYSTVVNENIEMFERLLRGIYAPQNVYCVHVDRKSPKPFHSAVQAITSCFTNVFVVGKSETVINASWSRVQADLNCVKELLRCSVPWRYLINVCGKDYPVKTNLEIVNSLMAMNSSNVIESDPPPGYKQRRWKCHHDIRKSVFRTDRVKSPPPIRSPMFVGSAYVLVTREFVNILFVNPEIQAFLKWSEGTYSPDEHIWATLQRMPEVPGSIPYTPGHHRGDARVLTRAVKWSVNAGDIAKGALYPPCTGRYSHQLCVYGSGISIGSSNRNPCSPTSLIIKWTTQLCNVWRNMSDTERFMEQDVKNE